MVIIIQYYARLSWRWASNNTQRLPAWWWILVEAVLALSLA